MASRDFYRAQRGPSLIAVVLGAALSLALGATLCLCYLVLKPARTNDLPRAPTGSVFYVEGTRDSSYAKQLMHKMQLFAKGSSVKLNEDELNAWMMSASMTPPSTRFFQINSPNFRIWDGFLQVGSKCELNVEMLNFKHQVIVQVMGRFKKEDDGFVLVPYRFYIGSFPLHRLPGLSRQVLSYFVARMPVPEDIRSAWKKLADVHVEGSNLKLTMP
jgi:hypothetical protein